MGINYTHTQREREYWLMDAQLDARFSLLKAGAKYNGFGFLDENRSAKAKPARPVPSTHKSFRGALALNWNWTIGVVRTY